jgi:malate dehydrogenase (quinone)
MTQNSHVNDPDVILIGCGIMSAHVGALLKKIAPSTSIQAYEVTDGLAQESSDGWNNAGTGHAGICELSYTPYREPDGSVKIHKAVEIFEQFELTRQFWAHAVESGMVSEPRDFINPIPHISFVHGQDTTDYLEARHRGLSGHHFFSSMLFSRDPRQISEWAPLLVEERDPKVPIAATHMAGGTDVNFGNVSRKLFSWLSKQENCGIATSHCVTALTQKNGRWHLTIRDLTTGDTTHNTARFVFVGAGGGSLPILQKAGIAEARGLGGFPIGGQWLVCDNPDIVSRHSAKVYGQPQPEAPTMAVPHLDTRFLDGKKWLLFGPFAAWTTKFLHKKGSWLDLPLSIRPHNLITLIKIGLSNLDLIKYLVQQGTQTMDDRLAVLRRFYPAAKKSDWRLIDAGIRVQAIKKTDGEAGIVHYGTEVITSADRSISALLGASPGASVCVHIALEVIQKCFPNLLKESDNLTRLKNAIPSFGTELTRAENADLYRRIHARCTEILGLQD